MKNQRWISLDIIKAIMVPAMIVVHNTIWWLSYHPEYIASASESWFLGVRYIAYLVLLIPATAGAALFFYLQVYNNGPLRPFLLILQRAILLVVAGFVMNVLAFGVDWVWQWNVLQFFSLSMIVIYFLLSVGPHWLVWFFGMLTLVSAPTLREVFSDYTDVYLVAILIGEPSNVHLWPFFPWFGVVAMGFWVAHTLYKKDPSSVSIFKVLSFGALLLLVSIFSGKFLLQIDFNNLWGESIFQPATYTMLGIVGVGMILLSCAHYFSKSITAAPYGLIQSFSFGLFYIYVIHMVVGHRLQQGLLQSSDSFLLLWLVILMQLLLAYLIGAGVVYLKERSKV